MSVMNPGLKMNTVKNKNQLTHEFISDKVNEFLSNGGAIKKVSDAVIEPSKKQLNRLRKMFDEVSL